mgnify:CR=1 FL=1
MLTVKNEYFGHQEIEKLLKNKMNELSDSVDCFDKISAKAFPSEKSDFSESGFTVSGLENVTGRSRKHHILKWAAISAAAVICIAVIPKTGFVNRVYKNMTCGSVKRIYQELLTEIDRETKENEYLITDYPLDFYIQNDVLITPLFRCPFEEIDKENVQVRLFIRQINGINTNQIYAAAYCDTYSNENILAAAESNFKFTQEEIDAVVQDISNITDFFSAEDDLISNTVESCFTTNDPHEILNSAGEVVSLASFEYASIVKTPNGIDTLKTSVIFGKSTELPESPYNYDIISKNGSGETVDIPRDEMWHRSMYFNGNSAMPTEQLSNFTHIDLFANSNQTVNTIKFYSILPYSSQNSDYTANAELTIGSEYQNWYSIISPSDLFSLFTLKLYYPSAFQNGIVEVKDGYDFLNSVDTYSEIQKNADQEIAMYKSQLFNLDKNIQELELIQKNLEDQEKIMDAEAQMLEYYEQREVIQNEIERIRSELN